VVAGAASRQSAPQALAEGLGGVTRALLLSSMLDVCLPGGTYCGLDAERRAEQAESDLGLLEISV